MVSASGFGVFHCHVPAPSHSSFQLSFNSESACVY